MSQQLQPLRSVHSLAWSPSTPGHNAYLHKPEIEGQENKYKTCNRETMQPRHHAPFVPCDCRFIIQLSPSSWYGRSVPPDIDGGCCTKYVGGDSSPPPSASVVESSASRPGGRPRRLEGLPPAFAAPSPPSPPPPPDDDALSSSPSESLRVTPKCVANISDWRRMYLILL